MDGRCTARKLTATGRDASAELTCHERAEIQGTPVDPACLATADGRLADGFEAAELVPPCFATGDVGAIGADVDALVSDLVTTVNGSAGDDRCRARKLHASAARIRGEIACYRSAAQFGTNPSPTCLDRARQSFTRNFARTGAVAGCSVADESTIDARILSFLDDAHTSLRHLLPSRCTGEKLNVAGRENTDAFECHLDGLPPAPACLADVDADVASRFAEAELDYGDCIVPGRATEVATSIGDFASDMLAAIDPPMSLIACSGLKYGVVATTTQRIVSQCIRRAYRFGVPLDPSCTANAHTRLAETFAEAESVYGPCPTVGDAAAISSAIDTFASSITTTLTVP